ncbi:MAG: chemotaxis protein CheW [Magnetococcus sp. MYC-9]
MEPMPDLNNPDLDEFDELDQTDLLLENVKDCIQLVTFRLGGEKYGLDVLQVQEIIRYSEPTPVPNVPDFVCGVTNLRGAILPVLDLRIRFGMSPRDYGHSDGSIILIVNIASKLVGVIADAVADVLYLPREHMAPPPDLFAQVDTEFIQGMGEARNELVILLNLEKLLSPNEIQKYILSLKHDQEPCGSV